MTPDTGVGLYGSFATAAQHGSLLFVSAMVGIDPATGKLVQSLDEIPDDQVRSFALGRLAADSWSGPIQAQCWQLFRNIEAILAQRGASLADILRVNMWIKDFSLLPVLMPVRSLIFAPHSPPAITNIGAAELSVPDAAIQVDVVAALDDVSALERRVTSTATSQQVGDYALGSVSGQLLFGVGMIAARNDSKRVITAPEDLGDRGKDLAPRGILRGAVEGRMRAQTRFILDDLRGMLNDSGSSTNRVAFARVYMKDIREYAAWEEEYLAAFDGDAPPTSVISCTELGMSDFRLEIETISVAADGEEPEFLASSALPAVVTGAAGLSRAGGSIFIPAQSGIDPTTKRIVEADADLQGVAAQAWHGPVLAQTSTIFDNIGRALQEQGRTLEAVVALYVYTTNPLYIPLIEQVAGRYFTSARPACSIVVVPEMVLPGAVVQIEAIAADRRNT